MFLGKFAFEPSSNFIRLLFDATMVMWQLSCFTVKVPLAFSLKRERGLEVTAFLKHTV